MTGIQVKASNDSKSILELLFKYCYPSIGGNISMEENFHLLSVWTHSKFMAQWHEGTDEATS